MYGVKKCCKVIFLPIRSVAISPDDSWAISAGSDGTIRGWDLETGYCKKFWHAHNTVQTMALSPNGHWVASAGYDKTIELWDPLTGKHIRSFKGHTIMVNSLAFYS